MSVSMTVRVATIRFQRPTGFGVVIFSGVPVDAAGSTTDASTYLVVRASRAVLGPTRVERGQWWSVRGPVVEREVTADGYLLKELQLDADEARLAWPSGEHIVRYLAENSAFEGIGTVKAQRLWDEHGERLYEVLDGADTAALAKTLTNEVAERLVQAWTSQGESQTVGAD